VVTAAHEYFGIVTETITDEDELALLAQLRARVAQIPSSLERWERVSRIGEKPTSQIALDDNATAWRHLSGGINHQLNHAADTLRALHTLMPPEGDFSLPYVAHFPVARSGLEASSLAIWILTPDDPRQRIERHLRNAWREVSEDAAMQAAILTAIENDATLGLQSHLDKGRKQFKRWKKKHTDQIRGVANRLGIPDPTQSRWTVGFAEVVREATATVGLPTIYGEVVWRQLSGLSHPSLIRATQSMNIREVHEHDDGKLGVVITSDATTVRLAVEATQLQFREAVGLFGRRKIQPAESSAYRPAPV
jgi:hypothetical protein